MSQNDFTIANQSFPAFRADLNSALQALASNNSGATEPSTTFANMWWYDSANNIMYIRNEDNDAWIKFAELDQANDKFVLSGTLQLDDGTVSAPALTFNSDTNMGIYRGGTDILKFVTAGTDAITIDASQNTTFAGTVVSDGMSTNTAGTSNFIAGLNAGDSIESGGNYNVLVGDGAGTTISTGDHNVAVGFEAGKAITTGRNNVAIGYQALLLEDANGDNVAIGYQSLRTLNAGADAFNTAVGYFSGTSLSTGTQNTIIGAEAGTSLDTGTRNELIGYQTGDALVGGQQNVAIGRVALSGDTEGQRSVAIGTGALQVQNFTSPTQTYNTAVGHSAGLSITTGTQNTLIGGIAGDAFNDADFNVAVGFSSLSSDTKGSRSTALGYKTLESQNFATSTDAANTAVGYSAGLSITTGTRNVLIGAEAGDLFDEGFYNVAVGYQTLSADVKGSGSVAIGYKALSNQQFGSATNTYNTAVGYAAGQLISTGTKNTIIGSYSGNQGGLDIRTLSNNIVLSDGDGNPRVHIDSDGRLIVGNSIGTSTWPQSPSTADEQKIQLQQNAQLDISTNQSGAIRVNINNGDGFPAYWYRNGSFVGSISVSSGATAYNTSSDHRLKENVVDMTGAIDRVKQLSPKRFNFIADDTDRLVDGFLAHEAQTVIPEAVTGTHNEVDDDDNPIMQGIDQSKLVPLLTGALKEAIAKIEDLEARIATLEGA
jgi:hypothetical protein